MMEITSAVTDVMVEEDIYNGILIEIFEYVHVEPSSVSRQRMTDDDRHDTTIIPSNTQEGIINLTLVSKRFYNIISNHHDENGTKKWNIIPVLEISPPPPSQQQQSSARTFFHNMYNYTKNNEIHNKQHYHHYVGHEDNTTKKCITQQALIKFVKNTARTLQWFRSDLSPENMRILRTEFENITFLN